MARGIGFWKTEKGNLLSHSGGFNEKELELLQSLKPGDRLVIYDNTADKLNEKSPDYSLKIFAQKEKTNENA